MTWAKGFYLSVIKEIWMMPMWTLFGDSSHRQDNIKVVHFLSINIINIVFMLFWFVCLIFISWFEEKLMHFPFIKKIIIIIISQFCILLNFTSSSNYRMSVNCILIYWDFFNPNFLFNIVYELIIIINGY